MKKLASLLTDKRLTNSCPPMKHIRIMVYTGPPRRGGWGNNDFGAHKL